MVLLGATVLIAILLAAALSTTTFSLPIMVSVAVASLAFIALGKVVINNAVDDRVKERSRELVSEFNLSNETDSFHQI
jgi:hypothetical protein